MHSNNILMINCSIPSQMLLVFVIRSSGRTSGKKSGAWKEIRGVDVKKTLKLYEISLTWVESHLPVLIVIFLPVGVYLGSVSERFADSVHGTINGFIDGYEIAAPLVIYLILTPALTKVFCAARKARKNFVPTMIAWFAGARLAALLWAVIFTTVVFDLPLVSENTFSFSEALSKSLVDLGWMLTHSPYFFAIYASLISVFVALRIEKLAAFFSSVITAIENLSRHMIPMIPLFMLGIGAYLADLPTRIGQQVGTAYVERSSEVAVSGGIPSGGIELYSIKVLGMSIDPNTATGMIIIYVVGALLTGIACIIWHGALLGVAKRKVEGFSIRHYFKSYWVRVYPLLWATSSEALSTPLNLYLVKKHYPQITSEIRGFTVGGGSFLGINGTVICVYVLAGLVTSILGIEVSFLQLLMSVPLIFLLGYGVPGIPGELIIFAGPIALILGLPEEVMGVFLALYIGLQIGLPDSFRTGANSTDNCVNGLILQDIYEKRYLVREPKEAELLAGRA